MTEQTDRELIGAFRNGDDSAFNLLVLRHQQRVYWLARRILGAHADADDVVQEVFLRVYRGLARFRGDSEFTTWLHRIAVNLALNEARKQKLRNFFRSDLLHDEVPSGSDDPERILLRKEEQSLFDRAVATLPPRQKTVFVMRYHEGMKFDEIAAALRLSTGGVKSNYFHALRRIDRFLKERER